MLAIQGDIDWSLFTSIIKVIEMKESNAEAWAKKYYTEEELQYFSKLGEKYTQSEMDAYSKKWEDAFTEVKQYLDTDPCGEVGQRLAKKWMGLSGEAYGDCPGLQRKIWHAFKMGVMPTENMPYYDQAVIDYISKAFEHYHKK